MKTKNQKTKVSTQSLEGSQSVELIVYFDGHENDHRAFWVNFDLDTVRYSINLQAKFENNYKGFRKSLLDYLLEISLLSNPDPVFYNCALSYLCGDKSIQNEINKYPNGGYAIIGHFNYNDESLSKFQFLDPKTFNNHLNKDYSLVPFNDIESGITLICDRVIVENLEEAIFLSGLVELIKESGYSCCNLSNEELIKFSPIPNLTTRGIAQILGKLENLGIIGVITYKSHGLNWYRDIFLKFPANHIQFVTQQKISA